MNITWSFLINMFANSTRFSYTKAFKLSNYHDAALAAAAAANPAYQVLYNRYHPLHLAFQQKYSEWVSTRGLQKGKTFGLRQELKQAIKLLDNWDVRIQVIHPRTTPRHTALFPRGHKPFMRGGVDSRISAFSILSETIGNEPALATIKAELDATCALLINARSVQESTKASKKKGSGSLQTTCRKAMDMQYRNAAWIADNFFDTRQAECSRVFDLQTLRDKRQRHFTLSLKPGQTKTIFKRTLSAGDQLRLQTEGQGSVSFYLATQRGGSNSNAIIYTDNQSGIITLSDFGITNYAAHRYLTVVSHSTETVSIEAEVL